eukprot:3159310-Pyramimonas_sp.AAC.1
MVSLGSGEESSGSGSLLGTAAPAPNKGVHAPVPRDPMGVATPTPHGISGRTNCPEVRYYLWLSANPVPH